MVETLQNMKKVFGEEHSTTTTVKYMVEAVNLKLGRHGIAVTILEEISISETQQLSADHPSTLTTKQILAVAYQGVEQ